MPERGAGAGRAGAVAVCRIYICTRCQTTQSIKPRTGVTRTGPHPTSAIGLSGSPGRAARRSAARVGSPAPRPAARPAPASSVPGPRSGAARCSRLATANRLYRTLRPSRCAIAHVCRHTDASTGRGTPGRPPDALARTRGPGRFVRPPSTRGRPDIPTGPPVTTHALHATPTSSALRSTCTLPLPHTLPRPCTILVLELS